MLNNGVHWASDYPLAIGIGYSFGRIIAARQRHKVEDTQWSVSPKIYDNAYGLALNYRY
jgi:alpha/beta superfamily hydrolase